MKTTVILSLMTQLIPSLMKWKNTVTIFGELIPGN